MNKSTLEKYADLIPIIQKIANDAASQNRDDSQFVGLTTPDHRHNGTDSNRISQSDIMPGLRTGGSITFATDATTYTLGTNFNPSGILFTGVALHTTTGTVDIHAQIIGNAQLGGNYYLQPGTQPFTTDIGGIVQSVIQGSSAMLIDSSLTPVAVRTTVSQAYIANVEYPSGTIVASLLVTSYGNGKVKLLSSLASGWQIIGNFIIT